MEKKRTSMEHVWLAVIAGGKGTRLFPISHEGCPKQFCNLNSSQTFIQATIQRFLNLGLDPTKILIITTNSGQTQLAREQTRKMGVLGQNICEVSEDWGYPGVMVEAAEIIKKYDEKAIIINTPSDQYIVEDSGFRRAMNGALNVAKTEGRVSVVGVKITDLTTATGCGHVVFDPEEDNGFDLYKMKDFVEKPQVELADKLMRSSSSACNTGINVWKVDTLLSVINAEQILGNKLAADQQGQKWELATDQFLKMFPEVYVTAGSFEWYDCGTLKALYEISPKKTPHHKNASIGGGTVDRTDCLNSLFYAADRIRLHVTGFRNISVIANVVEVNGKTLPIVCITKLEKSQMVKDLANNISASHNIFTDDFSFGGARNNIIMRSNISDEVVFGFVGESDCIVNVYKNSDGVFDVFASQQATKTTD